MLAMEIYKNGEKVVLAGVHGQGELITLLRSGQCNDSPSDQHGEINKDSMKRCKCCSLAVFGSQEYERTVRQIWLEQESLKPGDEIQISIVETDSVDSPVKEVQTIAKDRAQYESVKELYFELRDKFENEHDR